MSGSTSVGSATNRQHTFTVLNTQLCSELYNRWPSSPHSGPFLPSEWPVSPAYGPFLHIFTLPFLEYLIRARMIFFFFRVLHTIYSHLRAHALARYVTVARSSVVQASSSRRQERRWAIVCRSPQSQSTDWASSR